MTALQLQDDLAKEVERILDDMLFKDVNGNHSKMKAYPQELPKRKQEVKRGAIMDEENGEDPYPYCIVRIDSGSLRMLQEAQKVKVDLVFGIVDDDFERQGHRAILNIIQKITERFVQDPVLAGRYRMDEEKGIDWILDEEDRYPYYFGAMEMTWDTFFVTKKEDRYA